MLGTPDAIPTSDGPGILVLWRSPCWEVDSPFGTKWKRKSQGVLPMYPSPPSQTVEHGFPNQPSALAFDPELRIMAIGTRSGAVKMYPLPLWCLGIVRTSHVPPTLCWGPGMAGASWRQPEEVGWACGDSFQK